MIPSTPLVCVNLELFDRMWKEVGPATLDRQLLRFRSARRSWIKSPQNKVQEETLVQDQVRLRDEWFGRVAVTFECLKLVCTPAQAQERIQATLAKCATRQLAYLAFMRDTYRPNMDPLEMQPKRFMELEQAHDADEIDALREAVHWMLHGLGAAGYKGSSAAKPGGGNRGTKRKAGGK